MSGTLEDKVAVVTGAGSGLGLAASERFAAEGATVACVDLDGDSAAAAARSIAAAGGRALAIAADVSSPAAVDAALGEVRRDAGGIDVLYANAGVPGEGRAVDVDLAAWDRSLAVNLTGAFLCARAAIPAMVERGGGSAILQASAAGIVALPALAPYSAAKAGVVGLTRQLALDHAADGVRVNAICPGTVVTPLVEAALRVRGDLEAGLRRSRERTPMGRLGEASEVAALAAFLAGDEAAWITGAVIPIDGGLSLGARR